MVKKLLHKPQPRRRRRKDMTLEEALRASFKSDAIRRLGYLLKYGAVQFRGAAGRAARHAKQEALTARALPLHVKGLGDREIVAALGLEVNAANPQKIKRALKGHRVRRRTGAPKRGERGRYKRA